MLHDMHFHTINSDGSTKQYQLLDFLQNKKEDFLFLTPADHDIVSRDVVGAIKQLGLLTCEATEISAKNYDHDKSLHLTLYAKSIGYRIDQILKSTREQKVLMIMGQIEHLNKFGFNINLIDFYKFSCLSGKTIDGINKFDIARYIYSKLETRKIIFKINGGILQDHEFYNRYLKTGGDKYSEFGYEIDDYEPSIDVVSGFKEECDGILSIAHPNIIFKKGIDKFQEVLLHYIKNGGINAIEINTRASKEWVEAILHLSKKYGLYLTFGSDNHNIAKSTYSQGKVGQLNPNLDDDFVKRSFDKYCNIIL